MFRGVTELDTGLSPWNVIARGVVTLSTSSSSDQPVVSVLPAKPFSATMFSLERLVDNLGGTRFCFERGLRWAACVADESEVSSPTESRGRGYTDFTGRLSASELTSPVSTMDGMDGEPVREVDPFTRTSRLRLDVASAGVCGGGGDGPVGGESRMSTPLHPLPLSPSSLPNCVDVSVPMRRCNFGGLDVVDEVGVSLREPLAIGERDERRGTILLPPVSESTVAEREWTGENEEYEDDVESLWAGEVRIPRILFSIDLSEAPDNGVPFGERFVMSDAEFSNSGRGPDRVLAAFDWSCWIPNDTRDARIPPLLTDPVSDPGDISPFEGERGERPPVNMMLSLGGLKKAGRAGGE